jgi:putative ABC transport system permease protein
MHDLFTEMWESVRRNKLRTCLTGFAVAWGIFIIIVLLGAGNGLMGAFTQGGERFASNTMMMGGGVTSKPYDGLKTGRRIRLKESDMEMLSQEPFSQYVDQVTTSHTQGGYTLTYGRRYFNNVSLSGTFPGYALMNRMELLAGRFINDTDIAEKRKVIVLNHRIAKNFLLGGTDYERLLGEYVKVGQFSFLVVGIRRTEANTDDRDLYVPYTTVKTIFGFDNHIDQMTFTFHGLESEEANDEFERTLKAAVNTAHRAAPDDESATWIWNRFTQNLQMEKGAGILRTALWIIGLFTLLGGIVGVSNIMLITVKERTHEFGIRKAIGARPWSIMKLIVAESISITALFGYIGMALGMGACVLMDKTLGESSMDVFGEQIRMLVNPTVGIDVAIEATLVLIIAGTLAGLAPARKAAKVRPIEALRDE